MTQSKTVLLFPGQGSQYVGMGRDLCEASTEARGLYEFASHELGEDLAAISFSGPADTLRQTRFTQPAILVHSLAILAFIKESKLSFDFAAGHSLGEYGALVAAGAMSPHTAIRAVVRRAQLMEHACQTTPGTMAAIIGLDEATVTDLCKEASASGVVVPANINSSNQIVISGSLAGVEAAVGLARARGAKRALLLEVGGAFHSPLMESASIGLEAFLSALPVDDAAVPVIANVTAQPVQDATQIRSLLTRQVTAPVRWAATMEMLNSEGVETVFEIGPGKVLTGMAKREMKASQMINLDTMADIESYFAAAR